MMRDLWEPDEPRFTYVAWEMDQSDSWFVPMRNGEIYAHKPPLMFWLIKAGTFLTGGDFNGLSGRLPSLLGAILSLWAVSRMCLMWFDAAAAWRAVFVLSVSFLFWWKAGTGQIDMLLLGLEMTALYLLFSHDKHPVSWRWKLAFCFMGLAILAKGPVGLIVPAGIFITAKIFSGRKKELKKFYWLWGIPLALAFPAAWLMAAKASGAPPSYFEEILFKQNIGRVSGEMEAHVQPFYYYVKYLLAHFMPWTLFVPASIAVLMKDEKNLDRLKMIGGWVLFVVMFFSMSKGKRDLYILSVYPALSMMVAAAWPLFVNLSNKWITWTVYPLIGILIVCAIALLISPLIHLIPVSGWVFVPAGLILAAGSVYLLFNFRNNSLGRGWFGGFVATIILVELTVSMIVFPAFNPLKTPQALAKDAQELLAPDQRLLLYDMNGEIMALNSHRKGKHIRTPEELEKEMRASGKGIAVFSKHDWDQLKNRFQSAGILHEFKMGSKDLCYLIYDGGVMP
ncbi:MAG: glycosyltransferase family 39 protein [Desulfobacterales bacterium]|jgi:4-amino-4-deoxy-L-arabinose transferase-like glycosyltransferase|nr:glycosyltransferase family 39 protein [Desulfobacterales bacterium]